NTMMQSMRERVPELAVLKTLGYSDRSMLLLVLAEALMLCVLAAAVGLALGAWLAPAMGAKIPGFAGMQLTPEAALFGLVVAAAVYVLTNISKKGDPTHAPSNAVVRGTSPGVFAVRPEAHIVQGRMFDTGKREVVVGLGAHAEYEGLDVGKTVEVRDGSWTI